MSGPAHAGWLYKMKPNRKSKWDMRYFRIEGKEVAWYEDQMETKSKNRFLLKVVVEVKKATFSKTPKTHHAQCGFEVVTPARTYSLVAETIAEADVWIAKLQQAREYWQQRDWDSGGPPEQEGFGSEGEEVGGMLAHCD